MYDTIIIGAGMSGLAAGIRLAHFGRPVCILERHTTIGGLNSFYRLRKRDYDVGLHAVTNFVPRGSRQGPLPRLLETVTLSLGRSGTGSPVGLHDSFSGGGTAIREWAGIACASKSRRSFPGSVTASRNSVQQIVDYDDLNQDLFSLSAREQLAGVLRDPLLIEMLLCPLMWYGNPREHDMDYGQFCIMFRSIFMEGFARPHAGGAVDS